MLRIPVLYITLVVTGLSCGRTYKEDPVIDTRAREKMLEANKAVVTNEVVEINRFIAQHGWKMKRTGTGLHYDIYEPTPGQRADGESVLTIAYRAYLLDGTLCYEADEKNPLQLITGRGAQINGLEEGLLLMNDGSRARFVIPNHLAYGLTGDLDKIPPASPLYYEVHLLKVEKPQTNKQ